MKSTRFISGVAQPEAPAEEPARRRRSPNFDIRGCSGRSVRISVIGDRGLITERDLEDVVRVLSPDECERLLAFIDSLGERRAT